MEITVLSPGKPQNSVRAAGFVKYGDFREWMNVACDCPVVSIKKLDRDGAWVNVSDKDPFLSPPLLSITFRHRVDGIIERRVVMKY